MFHVVWFQGWSENTKSFDTMAEAVGFIDDTGLDPDEFEILQGEYPDL